MGCLQTSFNYTTGLISPTKEPPCHLFIREERDEFYVLTRQSLDVQHSLVTGSCLNLYYIHELSDYTDTIFLSKSHDSIDTILADIKKGYVFDVSTVVTRGSVYLQLASPLNNTPLELNVISVAEDYGDWNTIEVLTGHTELDNLQWLARKDVIEVAGLYIVEWRVCDSVAIVDRVEW